MKKPIMKTTPGDNSIFKYSSIITINLIIGSLESLYEAYTKYLKNKMNKLGPFQYATFKDSDFNVNGNSSLFISQTERSTNDSFPFNASSFGNGYSTETNEMITLFDTVLSPNQQVNWQISFDNSSGDQAEISYILFDYLDPNVQGIFDVMPECHAELYNNRPHFFFRAYTGKNPRMYDRKIKYNIYLRLVYQGIEFRISFDPLIQTRK